MGPSPKCYIPSHKVIGPLVLEKIFEGFSPIYGRGGHNENESLFEGSGSHNQDEAPYEMWLWLAQRFWRRRSLKMVDDGWTDRRRTYDGPWLYYKLTNEPKGSGELIKNEWALMLTAFFWNSSTSNSEVSNQIWPELEFFQRFRACPGYCKFDKDPSKCDIVLTTFSPL